MRVLVLLLALPLISAVGCQKTSSSAPLPSNIMRSYSVREADDLQRSFGVVCGNLSDCHPSVALLIARLNEKDLAVCTSFLVGPDTIMTNKHCLPPEIANGGSCDGLISFKFPKSDFAPAESAYCASVIATSPYPVDLSGGAKAQTDFALLKLKNPSRRPPLKINTGGVADNEILHIVRMTPNVSIHRGVIENLDCRVRQNTIITPVFSNNLSPVVHFADCNIVHGNSGSPALDSSGQVKAIVQQVSDMSKMKNNRFNITKNFGRGSNLSCVKVPQAGLNGSDSPACSADLSDAAARAGTQKLFKDAYKIELIKKDFKEQFQVWNQTAPKMIFWKLGADELSKNDMDSGLLMRLHATPLCLAPSDKKVGWLHDYREGSRLFLAKYQDHVSIPVQIPTFELHLVVDDDLQVTVPLKTVVSEAMLSFAPQDFADRGEMEVTIAKTLMHDGTPEISQGQLKTCTPEQIQAGLGF